MYIHKNQNLLKNNSLQDNVYFTLREIFFNADSLEDCTQVNTFNGLLTNNIVYEERTDLFQYTNILDETSYTKKLLNWLNSLRERHFDCEEDSLNEDYDSMEFHEWWKQFEELKYCLQNYSEQLNMD